MDAAVGDEPLDGQACDLAAERVEAGKDDGAGSVVDDQLDAGRELEGADVPSLAADDAPLHVVAGQVDDRHRRLDRVLGGAALDRLGDDLSGAECRRLARLALEALDERRGVAPRVGLDLLQQDLLGFVCRHRGDPLQFALLVDDQPVELLLGGVDGALLGAEALLARAQLPVDPFGDLEAVGERLGPLGQALLDALDLGPALARLTLGSDHEVVRLFFGLDERFLLAGVGLALGLANETARLLFGGADRFGGNAPAVGHPPEEHGGGRHQGDDEIEDVAG